MFNDLFGSDLDLSVGQFQVSDPLFKRRDPPALRGLPDLPGDAGRLSAST
ncbi:MAG: hypothetical protein MZV64_67860 [Ignavibacteriales bacterium]|nr:hypothetical protein [Ignavibacteriales bacterium]